MTTSVVGTRYARALVDVIFNSRSVLKPEDVSAQIRSLEETIQSSPDLQAILMTPAVPIIRKKAVISDLSQQLGISPTVRNFVNVILDHKRMAQLSEMRVAFDALVDEHLGVVRAEVTSAAPLDDAHRQTIENELTRMSGKRVRMQTSVDPELLGGVIARIGSTVYDGSLRGQLEGLRRKLTSESADFKVGI